MLGLVKRTCHFVKNPSQKRALYLSLVSSQFNHCSSVWRPTSIVLLNKIERVQVKAIKWILSEWNTTYSDVEYFNKCKELDLLPLKLRLDFFAITLFHKIIHKIVAINLPMYITLAPPTNLRSSHNDHLTFKSQVKPRIIKKVLKFSKTIKKNKPKIITFQCKVKTSKHSCKKVVKDNKNKHISKKATFKRKRPKRENIFKPDINGTNNVDDFTESKVFRNSFFYKTHLQWNNLPLELRVIEEHEKFSSELKEYLWESIHPLLDIEADLGCPDTSIT